MNETNSVIAGDQYNGLIAKLLPYLIVPLAILSYYSLVCFSTFGGYFLYSTPHDAISALYSLLVYDGISNLKVFGIFTPFLLILLISLPRAQKFYRSVFTIIGMFVIASLGVIWFNSIQGPTFGQSAVLYALLGLILGYSIIDSFILLRKKSFKEFLPTAAGAVIMLLFFTLDSSLAFNIKANVAWQIHELTFGIGITVGLLFSLGQGIILRYRGESYGGWNR